MGSFLFELMRGLDQGIQGVREKHLSIADSCQLRQRGSYSRVMAEFLAKNAKGRSSSSSLEEVIILGKFNRNKMLSEPTPTDCLTKAGTPGEM